MDDLHRTAVDALCGFLDGMANDCAHALLGCPNFPKPPKRWSTRCHLEHTEHHHVPRMMYASDDTASNHSLHWISVIVSNASRTACQSPKRPAFNYTSSAKPLLRYTPSRRLQTIQTFAETTKQPVTPFR